MRWHRTGNDGPSDTRQSAAGSKNHDVMMTTVLLRYPSKGILLASERDIMVNSNIVALRYLLWAWHVDVSS